MMKRRSRRLSGKRIETLRPEGVQPRQDFYNEFFQKSPIATALLDNRNDVMEINEAFHHLFGYSQEEARGQHLDTLIAYKEVVEEAHRLTEDTIAGRIVTLETVRYSKSGEGIPVAILAYPVYDREQKVAVYATYADIRERLIYEKQLNTYSRILERSTEAVCIFSENGTINWVNRTFHELIGPYEEQWIETLQNLCVVRQEVYAEIMEALNAGQAWRGMCRPPASWAANSPPGSMPSAWAAMPREAPSTSSSSTISPISVRRRSDWISSPIGTN